MLLPNRATGVEWSGGGVEEVSAMWSRKLASLSNALETRESHAHRARAARLRGESGSVCTGAAVQTTVSRVVVELSLRRLSQSSCLSTHA
ncbi:unnamed protein product [Protopolystoma xenopodis]|uniref:Uncharacterized protein n=1 Tax=Protopolystoma xenopodis TaxID=117903 RepID=A0A448WV78_9PLAT|nr:unnamed protein product [Protopolystoma xenopodis]